MFPIFTKEIKINFKNNKFSDLELDLFFFQLHASYLNTIIQNVSKFFTKECKIDFENKNWTSANRKWNCFSNFKVSDEKTKNNVSHFDQGVQNKKK